MCFMVVGVCVCVGGGGAACKIAATPPSNSEMVWWLPFVCTVACGRRLPSLNSSVPMVWRSVGPVLASLSPEEAEHGRALEGPGLCSWVHSGFTLHATPPPPPHPTQGNLPPGGQPGLPGANKKDDDAKKEQKKKRWVAQEGGGAGLTD